MQGRIEKWDILKFGLIFLVVLGHIADEYVKTSETMRSLYLFIYSFHMPLFIFISGLFSKNTVNNKRVDRMFGFFLMYLFSKAVISLYWSFAGETGRFSIDILNANGAPWFMLAMCVFPIITYLVRNVKPAYVLLLAVALALLIGYDRKLVDTLAVSRITVFFPFYYLGYITEPKKVQEFTDKRIIKIFSTLIIVAFLFAVFYLGDKIYAIRPLLTARNPYMSLGSMANYGALLRFGCYIMAVVLSVCFIAVTPNRTPFKFISNFGARTISVYVFHYVAIYLCYNQLHLNTLFDKILPNGGSGLLIIPLALIITLVLSLKIFYVPINALMNLPQKAKKQ